MSIAMNYTKLVVGDLETSERFYLALRCRWSAATGDANAYVLILGPTDGRDDNASYIVV